MGPPHHPGHIFGRPLLAVGLLVVGLHHKSIADVFWTGRRWGNSRKFVWGSQRTALFGGQRPDDGSFGGSGRLRVLAVVWAGGGRFGVVAGSPRDAGGGLQQCVGLSGFGAALGRLGGWG